MKQHFTFLPRKLVLNDIGKDIQEFTKINDSITEASSFKLIESLLSDKTIDVVNKAMEILYQSNEFCFSENDRYEVEAVLAKRIVKGQVYYKVKWKRWPISLGGFEPVKNLVGSEQSIEEFERRLAEGNLPSEKSFEKSPADQLADYMYLLRKAVKMNDTSASKLFRMMLNCIARHQGLRPFRSDRTMFLPPSNLVVKAKTELMEQELKKIEAVFQESCPGEASITIENFVDFECLTLDYELVNKLIPGKGVKIPTKAVVGCDCSSRTKHPTGRRSIAAVDVPPCWTNFENCCAASADAKRPYSLDKKMLLGQGEPIYECNSQCKCGSTCPFRVVQLGRQVPLAIFRTLSRGWGVKACTNIPKGTFICEYFGEVITVEEAERRERLYDKQQRTYLYDLDFDGKAKYAIDSYSMGNLARYFNHSCDPNLTMNCTFIDCLDTKLPRLAFFARKYIKNDEELTFDYKMRSPMLILIRLSFRYHNFGFSRNLTLCCNIKQRLKFESVSSKPSL